MKFCVIYVYWILLLISVVSSGLLFLIVASESTQGGVHLLPSEKHGNSDEFNNATESNTQDKKSEISKIRIGEIQTDNTKDESSKEEAAKVSSSFDAIVNAEETQEEKDLDVIAESIIQQPNLSQGISETGQAVVLTLVDTAAAELQSLAEPRIDQDLQSRSSTKNLSSKANDGSIRYSEQQMIDGTGSPSPVPTSPTIGETTDRLNDTTATLDEAVLDKSTGEESGDIVVVVRAEQKIATDSVVDVRLEEEIDPFLKNLPEDLPKVEEGFGAVPELNDTAARARIIGGNHDEAASTVIINGLGTAGPSDPHEDMPSFSEWQKRLEEAEKKKTHPNVSVQTPGAPGRGVGNMKVRSKNYASPDCGAKIVAVNPEADHAKSVLAASRDEYMLNACTSRVWFVVELCEAIQAKKIELANFELFSSSPKDFSVYVSDRFPTREWSPVGQFTAKDERDIQSFTLHPQLFGQFIKVELQSHYGSEHFCPISLFRAYGTSEFEVLETETENQVGEADDEDDEDSDEEEILDADGTPSRNLFGSARDAVLSIVKKAAEVLVKSSDLSGNNITNIQQSIDATGILESSYSNCMTPRYAILCKNCSDERFARVFQLVSCHDRRLDDLLKIDLVNETLRRGVLCESYGINVSSHLDENNNDIERKRNYSLSSESKNLHATFLSSVFKTEYIIALCNVLAAKERRAVLNTSYELLGSESKNVTKDFKERSSKTADHNNDAAAFVAQESVTCTADSNSSNCKATSTREVKQRQESIPEKAELSTSRSFTETVSTSESLASQIKPTKTLSGKEDMRKESSFPSLEPSKEVTTESSPVDVVTTVPPVTNLPTSTFKIIEESSTLGATIETQSQTITTLPVSNIASQESSDNVASASEATEASSQSKMEKGEITGTKKLEQTEDDKGRNEASEQDAKLPPSQDHLNFDSLLSDLKDLENDAMHLQSGSAGSTLSNTHSTASTTPQQKESVFLRLSNRIKALERNMSLSGQYLEELSRRYKKQVEEMQRSLERAITAMSEESRKGEERDSKRLEEIATLKEEIAMLSKSVQSILYDRDSWRGRLSAICQHVLLICFEVFIVILVLSYCRRAADYEEDEIDQSTSKKSVTRRKSAENFTGHIVPKKVKKRRPSEIASHISGTYRELMINDRCQESKKERKKKRKRESHSKIASIDPKKDCNRCKSVSNLAPPEIALPTRKSSAAETPKVENNENEVTQGQPESNLDLEVWSENKDGLTSVRENKTTPLEKCLKGDDFSETCSSSSLIDKWTVDSISPSQTDFSKDGAFSSIEILKESSPSFMRTALSSRKKRILLIEAKSETETSNFNEAPYQEPSKETLGGPYGCTTNGIIEDSDESRSSSTTPTPGKKDKKATGLKKMVRKLF